MQQKRYKFFNLDRPNLSYYVIAATENQARIRLERLFHHSPGDELILIRKPFEITSIENIEIAEEIKVSVY